MRRRARLYPAVAPPAAQGQAHPAALPAGLVRLAVVAAEEADLAALSP